MALKVNKHLEVNALQFAVLKSTKNYFIELFQKCMYMQYGIYSPMSEEKTMNISSYGSQVILEYNLSG